MKKKVLVSILIICLILSNITLVAANGGVWKTVDVLLNEMIIRVNGEYVPAGNILYNGVTYVPLRTVSEALGANVNYIDETKTIEITTPSSGTGAALPASLFPLHLYSNDTKTYLGKLTTDIYDADSIWNEYGTYGSKYQTNSIWNEYGDYGSKYSNKSAFNEYATEPPKIFDNQGNYVGYLTTNEYLEHAFTIQVVKQFLEDNNQ